MSKADAFGMCAIVALITGMITWGLGSYYGRMAERDRAIEMARTVNDMRIEDQAELALCREMAAAIDNLSDH